MSNDPLGPERGARRRYLSRDDLEARAHATGAEIRAQVAATRAQLDATNVRIEARTGRNLPLAIVIGLALGGSMLLSLILVKALFMIVAAVLIGFTAFELASALRFSGRSVPRVPTVIAAVAIVPCSFYYGANGRWFAFLGGMALVALWTLVAARWVNSGADGARGSLLADLGAGVFIQAYVAFLGSFAVLLTAQPGGEWWTLAFLLLVISTDTGAYASGLAFGKHPMAPRISPKKTWEGFAGGVVLALTVGAFLAVFMIHEPVWVGLLFGAAIVASATLGDLAESLIKRDLGIKDISTWLPGHGGFLDRLDSVLPSAAVAYGIFTFFG